MGRRLVRNLSVGHGHFTGGIKKEKLWGHTSSTRTAKVPQKMEPKDAAQPKSPPGNRADFNPWGFSPLTPPLSALHAPEHSPAPL
jgi:hypothetical protein